MTPGRTTADRTKRSSCFRHPAEWERHEATWITWPKNPADWPGKFAPIPWVFAEIVRKLTPGERVRLVVDDAAHEAKARRALAKVEADMSKIDFVRIKTDRGWNRDSGPLFVRTGKGKSSGLAVAAFGFTAWAKYPNHRLDAKVHKKAAAWLGLPALEPALNGKQVVLEGGSIDFNGRGTVLTTEECLLDPKVQVRNPGFTKAEYETVFADLFGVTNTIWLKDGIAGDDTHGHVDDLCRFVNGTTVVLVEEKNEKDANFRALAENRERLKSARLEDGSKIRVVPLPMPEPLIFDGTRLPASYANFYIGNEVVLVPTFNDPNDAKALGILSDLFPGRKVVGIHAVDLVWGFGTIHCLTHEEPAR